MVVHIEETPENRVQTHHFKVGTAHNSGAHFTGIPQADHGEPDGREIADLAEGFHTGAQILNFGY